MLQTPAKASLADTLMAAAGRLSPFQDEADLRAAPEDLSSASDSGSQTPALQNGMQLQNPPWLAIPHDYAPWLVLVIVKAVCAVPSSSAVLYLQAQET